MNARELNDLAKRIAVATGRDAALNRRIAHLLDGMSARDEAPDYTGSVDECLALIRRVLPHWHWHVGHGPSGVLPYAALTREGPAKVEAARVEAAGVEAARVEMESTTVPLALLGAAVKARLAEGKP